MATKAQRFREEAVQAAHHKAPRRTAKKEPRLTHNQARRVDGRSSYALEPAGARASRKSTRGGANRAKPDTALRSRARDARLSPTARRGQGSSRPLPRL